MTVPDWSEHPLDRRLVHTWSAACVTVDDATFTTHAPCSTRTRSPAAVTRTKTPTTITTVIRNNRSPIEARSLINEGNWQWIQQNAPSRTQTTNILPREIFIYE